MFDANLILLDGSIDLTAALDTPAISTTIDSATGAKVLDIGETGVNGLVAVLICVDDVVADADTLTAYLQASDTIDMTAATDIERLGSFGVANATTGVILGSETPCVAMVKFATKKRYVRLNATVGASPDDFLTVKCYLEPFSFKTL